MSSYDPANRGNPLGNTFEGDILIRDVPYTGVNNRSKARDIGQTEAAELLNVDLEDPTTPKKRDGYKEVESGHKGLGSGSQRGVLMDTLDAGPATRLMVVGFEGGETYTTRSPNVNPGWKQARVTKEPGGAVSPSRALSLSSTTLTAKQGNDLLWLVGGDRSVHVLNSEGNWTDCGASNESPPSGAMDATYMLSRMWMISRDRLYWSKLLPTEEDLTPTPAAWDRANITVNGGGSINMSPEKSAEPVAILPWREQSLIIFYKNQIEEVVVNPLTPIDSSRRRVESRFGCGARDSIVQVGQEVYFLDQYGTYRALRRNEQSKLQGVIAEPLSDRFRGELPNNLNVKQMHKCQSALLGEFLYLFYPAGTSDDPNRTMVVDLGGKRLYGPWEWARPMSRVIVSDIEGVKSRIYGLDGGNLSRVYRFFEDTYSDNGTAITYRETGRAWSGPTGGVDLAHTKKMPLWFDMEFKASPLSRADFSLRTSENDSFVSLSSKVAGYSGTHDFPVKIADTPILAADFPLETGVPTFTSMKGRVDETHTGSLPLHDQDLPIMDQDLPLDSGGGVGPGRVVQWRIEESTDGASFERIGVRVGCRVENVDLEDET